MEWTTNKPAQEGYFWRQVPEGEPHIVYVDEFGYIEPSAAGAHVDTELEGTLWAGPLHPPGA